MSAFHRAWGGICALNASLLCAGSRGMRFFSEAAVAGHGLGRLDWAESEPTEAALGKSGVPRHSRRSIAGANQASPPSCDIRARGQC